MQDLDRALCDALKRSIDFVEEKGGSLDPESVAAYEYAKAHLEVKTLQRQGGKMSEPRKLYTGSASGGLDQEQYEAARRRAQQLAEQNARRRTVQQPMRTAQGRHISQRPAAQPAPEPMPEPVQEPCPAACTRTGKAP